MGLSRVLRARRLPEIRNLLGCSIIHPIDLPVIFLIFLCDHALDPILIIEVPFNRPAKPFLKVHLRLPTKLLLDLGAIEGIAEVVGRTAGVLDVLDLRC